MRLGLQKSCWQEILKLLPLWAGLGEGKLKKRVKKEAQLLNASAVGRPFFYHGDPTGITGTRQAQTRQLLLSFPLFVSFFRHHVNAKYQKTYAEYTKTNPERQGQVFEEVTSKADTYDVFSKVSNCFSGKFPSFFINKMAHTQLLSTMRLNDRGELYVNRLGETS